MTDPSPITRSGAQHAAKHELSKAIYHRNADPLAVRAVKWAGHLVDRILNHTAIAAPGGAAGALALVVIVVAVVAVIVWRVGIPRGGGVAGAVFAVDVVGTAAEHRQLADAATATQDWSTAVIERMRAVARELEERNIVIGRAGRTATEVARDAAVALPNAGSVLEAAASTFNAVAYGGSPGSAADAATMVVADDAVRQTSRSLVIAQ
jgi:hypothetical protein